MCRVIVGGVSFKIVRVCWTGRGGGYTYRVYRGRTKYTREEYASWFSAWLIMFEAVDSAMNVEDRRAKS